MEKTSPMNDLQTSTLQTWTIDQIEEFLIVQCVELSKKRHPIKIDALYIRARRELGAPRIQIERAIDNLIASKTIIPGKYLHLENLLENETRKMIYNAIAALPAILAQNLKDTLDLGTKMLFWHLKRLLDFGFIKQVEWGTFHLFATQATSDNDAIVYHVMARNVFLQLVLRTLDDTQIPLSTLIQIVPVKRTTLLYHLQKLIEAGVIESPTESDEKMYQISNQFKQHVYAMLEEYFPEESN